ncbi:MAG: hypothetical protein J1G02_06385 [Clostridiales bacterium]|nr:hypothetical protein [Clostridiales bacterium]
MGNSILVAKESDIVEVDALTFYTEFTSRRHLLQNATRVIPRELEHYQKNCKHFLMLRDHSAGLAIEQSGRIISVFNAGEYHHAGTVLLTKAINLGGNKLECFDVEQLRYIYMSNGFIPVSRYLCDLSDKEDLYLDFLKKEGRKNIYILFWIYRPMFNVYRKEDIVFRDVHIKTFETEEEAEKFRDKILKECSSLDKLSQELRDYLNTIIIIKQDKEKNKD